MKESFSIGGISAKQLADEYGLPLYVYDGGIIKRQFQRMQKAFDVPELRINYALKALSNVSILRYMNHLGSCLDAVSMGEVQLGLHAGFNRDRIMYTPNMVALEEIRQVKAMGIPMNIDNIEMLEALGHEFENLEIGIRVNPHVMAGGNQKISVGHIDSKFGISFHQMPLVRRLTDNLGIRIKGVHMHTGSDILDVGVFLQAAEILLNVAKEFPDLEYIDFGSGFKVKYKPEDYETDIEEFGKELGKRFRKFCKEYGRELTLVFEPGKFLVSESGYFLVRTNLIKQTTSTVFAGVDSGFQHLGRPMMYGSHHEIENISNPEGKPRLYTVVGYICETDTFAYNRKIPQIQVGDILCMRNAGAYCFSMASHYNSRLLPAEVLVLDGKSYLIREREKFEDLLIHQTDPSLSFND
ncbi:MAG TPA: diaminopimelate decarboxylase [Saprospiraceae bacterium]|nr:diaminopimelate decarboxylase [Saprospiraceae bacterium]